MIVRATAYHTNFLFTQNFSHSLGIFENLLCVFFIFWSHRFAKSHGFCRNSMHVWTALNTRENRFVNFLGDFFIFASKNYPSARTTEGFVCGGSDNIKTIVKWITENSCGN